MNKILSIIVPSYNMEDYLNNCLSSLVCRNIDKLDIIIVNDGSKDRTAEIGASFVDRHPNSATLIDKTNGNYGSCINEALKVSKGKYVKVLDADDSFSSESIDKYIDFLSTIDSDIVVSDYCRVSPEGKEEPISFNALQPYKETLFEAAFPFLKQEVFGMHAVAYKTDILRRISYRQTEGISYTDMEWMFLPITQVYTLSYFPHILYRYLIGREGQTVSTTVSIKSIKQTAIVVMSMLENYARVKDQLSATHREYLENRLRIKTPSIYRIYIIKQPDYSLYPDLKHFDEKLRNCYPQLYDDMEKENLKVIPFRFIKYWRKHYNGSSKITLLSILSRTYARFF